MKKINDNPWELLEIPISGKVSSKRLNSQNPYDFYIGKNTEGKYLLIFLLNSVILNNTPVSIQMNGIDIKKEFIDNKNSICLILKDVSDWQIFKKICVDVCEYSAQASEERNAVKSFYNRLLYWQYFLNKSRENVLSKEEQIGLSGELIFLEKFVLKKYSALDAVNYWTGCEKDTQDFSINNKRIEIKTTISPSKEEVQISSLEQLYTLNCQLELAVILLGKSSSDHADSFSLYSLADRIACKLKEQSIPAFDLFLSKLASAGFILDGSCNDDFYIFNTISCYHVLSGFPRLTPENISLGIKKVKYILDLEKCTSWIFNSNEILD